MRAITNEEADKLQYIKKKPVVLVHTTINGVVTACIAAVTPSKKGDGSLDIEPIAILCNAEIFGMITPPTPDSMILIETIEEEKKSDAEQPQK